MVGFERESRAVATAWLAPFPPGPVEKEEAVKVSPPEGTRGVTVTRSTFREPIMVIVLGDMVVDIGGFLQRMLGISKNGRKMGRCYKVGFEVIGGNGMTLCISAIEM